jgi:pyridoxal biosynthesis lyase PdxS
MTARTVHGVCRRGHALELHIEQETRTGVIDCACPLCGAPVTAHVRLSRIHVPEVERPKQIGARQRDVEYAANRKRWKALGL